VVVLAAVALLTARPAAGRDAGLTDLQPLIGRVVLIETDDRPQIVARLVNVSDSVIVASVGGIETTFRERDVRSVAADLDSTRIGLWIGAGFGATVAILGPQGLSCTCPGQVAAGAVISVAAFTGLGALIGKHHHRRVTVYQRASPRPPPVPRR
jgi:hypothetical protein